MTPCIAAQHGEEVATALYLRFVQSFAQHVARLDPDMFDADQPTRAALDAALRAYEDEVEDPFPQTAAQQLADVLRSMARAWEGTSARLLRQAKGAPVDAGLGLVVQAMAGGIGAGSTAAGCSGAGQIRFIDTTTGAPAVKGRFQASAPGKTEDALYLARDARGPSLEERCPPQTAWGCFCISNTPSMLECSVYFLRCGGRARRGPRCAWWSIWPMTA